MGVLGRLLGRKTAEVGGDTVVDALAALLDPGTASKTGAQVNIETAIRVSTMLACVRVLAEGIAQLPLKLYRQDERRREPARDHPLYRLLHRTPNDWQTSFEFRETMMFYAALAGDAVAFKNVTKSGRVVELLPLDPRWLRIEQQPDFTLAYKVKLPSGDEQLVSRKEVLHVRGPSWNGYAGLAMTKQMREPIGLAIATEEAHALFHRNGGRPGGILSIEGNLSPESKKQLKEEWSTAFGAGNSFRTAVLDAGAKWEAMAMKGVDAQHLETRRFQVEEICRAMRVFPQMVGHADKTATYASAEQFFLAHVIHCLGPWVERWEQAMDRDLLSEDDIEKQLFTKFTVSGLLRGDAKGRAEFYGKGIQDGWMTRNEAREREDLNPLPGLDEPLRLLNMGRGGEPPPAEEDDD